MIYLFENSNGFYLYDKNEQNLNILDQYKYKNNEEALCSLRNLINNELPENLKSFLLENLKEKADVLAVRDEKLSNVIKNTCQIQTKYVIDNTFKNIRDIIDNNDSTKDLFLSHKLCLEKIQLDSNKIDTMIIQSISLLVDLDKDINLHVMRIREWYGLHFPELSLMIDDNLEYLKLLTVIKQKESCTLEVLEEVCGDEVMSKRILSLCKNSMGADLSDLDLQNILVDSESIIKNFEFREKLLSYIKNKMNLIAPNVTKLVGEIIGARLISKAGSLSALSKYPSSTVQLLGAEKSLFQALKRQRNTPKYGIIFDSSLLGQVQLKFKGKVARSLASKISLCARMDYSGNDEEGRFGELMKEKIMKRIKALDHKSNLKKKSKNNIKKEKFSGCKLDKYDTKNDVKRVKKEKD